MDILDCHNCGERQNNVGHHWSRCYGVLRIHESLYWEPLLYSIIIIGLF
jgi:hypothetical protein